MFSNANIIYLCFTSASLNLNPYASPQFPGGHRQLARRRIEKQVFRGGYCAKPQRWPSEGSRWPLVVTLQWPFKWPVSSGVVGLFADPLFPSEVFLRPLSLSRTRCARWVPRLIWGWRNWLGRPRLNNLNFCFVIAKFSDDFGLSLIILSYWAWASYFMLCVIPLSTYGEVEPEKFWYM